MKNNFCTFYLVRHGETEWNVKHLVQGHSDSPLTEEGILQAKALAKKLSNIEFDLVFSSDLMRARKTAQIITLERNLEVLTTHALRERRWGNFEGKDSSLIDAFEETLRGLNEEEEKEKHREQNLELEEEIAQRLLTFLRETAVANPGKTVLVVTHGRTLSTTLKHLGFWEEGKKPKESISNGALVKIESDGVEFFIRGTEGIKR